MSLVQRNFVAYLQYLKSRHPLMKTLMTLLNVTKLLQIPAEMIVSKFFKAQKSLFVLVIECWKAVLKFGIWQGSGWRGLPRNFSISLDRLTDNGVDPETEEEDFSKDSIKMLDIKMNQLEFQLKESKSKDPLNRYLTSHKSNVYTGEPSLTFNPCSDWKSWTRELSHILRPCIYGTIEEISLTLFNCNFFLCFSCESVSLVFIIEKWQVFEMGPFNHQSVHGCLFQMA